MVGSNALHFKRLPTLAVVRLDNNIERSFLVVTTTHCPSQVSERSLETTEVKEAVDQLLGRGTKLESIARVLPGLSDQDWRHLTQVLSARRFQYDIVGNLPIELSTEVFKCLNLHAISELGLVCKRWYALTTNRSLLNILLGAKLPSVRAALCNETPLSNTSTLRRLFRRCKAFRACEPVWLRRYTSLTLRIPSGKWETGLRKFDFCESMQAEITSLIVDDDALWIHVVTVTNFRTGRQHTIHNRNEFSVITGLTITSRICGWSTSKRYVNLLSCYQCKTGSIHVVTGPCELCLVVGRLFRTKDCG